MSSRVLLLDIDNCPDQLALLPESLKGVTRAVACHGAQSPKLPLSLVPQLAPALHDGTLEIVAMAQPGKNAADFGLAFHAGRLLAEMPPDTEFLIVSKDAGLDHVLDLLRRAGRKATRLPARQGTSSQPRPSGRHEATIQKIQALLRGGGPRPRKRNTLRNTVKQHLPAGADADSVVEKLFAGGVVRADANGRLTYADESGVNGDDIPF